MTRATFGHLLGRASGYPTVYDPGLLEGVPRALGREPLLGSASWPHFGEDVWTAYELGFRLLDGRPVTCAAELMVPAHSPQIVESKSLKLYLFSLNNSRFAHRQAFAELICGDVGSVVGVPVRLRFLDASQPAFMPQPPEGLSIDDGPYRAEPLDVAASQLTSAGPPLNEVLHSQVMRSLCPVTAQPDWATVVVRSCGPALDRARLLTYLAAFYDHQGFHEQCVERIFLDLWRLNSCSALTVYARYTRRGGIDINPIRSSQSAWAPMRRDLRQ